LNFYKGTVVNGFGEIHPKQQVVYTGQPFKIICDSFSKPRWTFSGLNYKHMAKNVPVRKKFVEGNMIFFKKASPYSYGKYNCSGDKNTGVKFYITSTVYVGGN